MSLTDSVEEISKLFESEISLSTSLLQTLKDEQNAISSNDMAAFESSIIEKDKLVREIEAVEQTLVTKLQQKGLSVNKQDLNELISSCAQKDKIKLTGLIETIREVAAQCQQQNIINSKIIDANQNNIQKLIGIIRGQSPDQNGLYDLSGKSSNSLNSQFLGSV